MAAHKYKANERIALSENVSYRGYISSVIPAGVNEPKMYGVQWDKYGCFLYLQEALISEAEAIVIENELKLKSKIGDSK